MCRRGEKLYNFTTCPEFPAYSSTWSKNNLIASMKIIRQEKMMVWEHVIAIIIANCIFSFLVFGIGIGINSKTNSRVDELFEEIEKLKKRTEPSKTKKAA